MSKFRLPAHFPCGILEMTDRDLTGSDQMPVPMRVITMIGLTQFTRI